MGHIVVRLLTMGALFGALAAPQLAFGGETLSPPVGGAVVTRYGVGYETPVGSATHRGLDLGAAEGAPVLAAADGVVTFAGLVPADGGGRSTAITITTPSGLLVTVSPLLAAGVGKGAHVAAGDELGTLAGAGDASSTQSHVHLSVRVGGTYVDPQPMLGSIEPDPASEPESEPQPVVAPQTAPQPAAPPAPAASAQPVANTRAPGVSSTQVSAVGSPAAGALAGHSPVSAAAAGPEVGTRPAGITLRALERAQAGLRAGAGAHSGAYQAAHAAHIAPEMLREKATFEAPHLSGARTASVGVLLAAAAGLALWSGLDRRAVATARGGVE